MGDKRFKQGHKVQTCLLPAQYNFIKKLASETGNTLAATHRHIINTFMTLYNKSIVEGCDQCVFELMDEVEKILKVKGMIEYGKTV